MTSRDLRVGEIIHYPYLWKWQADRGETEGRKDRPVCVAIAVSALTGKTKHLALLAISSQPPGAGQTAIEVPETERRRAGLTEWRRAWIATSEYNYDILGKSF